MTIPYTRAFSAYIFDYFGALYLSDEHATQGRVKTIELSLLQNYPSSFFAVSTMAATTAAHFASSSPSAMTRRTGSVPE